MSLLVIIYFNFFVIFSQLFGEYSADEDVSPDTADPEAAADAGAEALTAETKENGNVQRTSTRQWAQSCNYDPKKLFNKLFNDDIKYLLSMANLWKNRTAPLPADFDALEEPGTSDTGNGGDAGPTQLRDQKVWSLVECGKVFENCVKNLRDDFEKLKEGDNLVWDKDDKNGMDFVAACANIRAHIFGIAKKSRFEIKSMAGNIIPAIATTNAITAGFVVMHALKVLQEKYEKCQNVYMRLRPNARNQLMVPDKSK
jgi:ubiquitin-like 1-activating enzyme E1 B